MIRRMLGVGSEHMSWGQRAWMLAAQNPSREFSYVTPSTWYRQILGDIQASLGSLLEPHGSQQSFNTL